MPANVHVTHFKAGDVSYYLPTFHMLRRETVLKVMHALHAHSFTQRQMRAIDIPAGTPHECLSFLLHEVRG